MSTYHYRDIGFPTGDVIRSTYGQVKLSISSLFDSGDPEQTMNREAQPEPDLLPLLLPLTGAVQCRHTGCSGGDDAGFDLHATRSA